jgi:hypothetical protein
VGEGISPPRRLEETTQEPGGEDVTDRGHALQFFFVRTLNPLDFKILIRF